MTAKTEKLKEYGTLTKTAEHLGVAKSTLRSAILANHVATAQLGFGESVVSIQSAKKWAASDRKPGRPRSADKTGD